MEFKCNISISLLRFNNWLTSEEQHESTPCGTLTSLIFDLTFISLGDSLRLKFRFFFKPHIIMADGQEFDKKVMRVPIALREV